MEASVAGVCNSPNSSWGQKVPFVLGQARRAVSEALQSFRRGNHDHGWKIWKEFLSLWVGFYQNASPSERTHLLYVLAEANRLFASGLWQIGKTEEAKLIIEEFAKFLKGKYDNASSRSERKVYLDVLQKFFGSPFNDPVVPGLAGVVIIPGDKLHLQIMWKDTGKTTTTVRDIFGLLPIPDFLYELPTEEPAQPGNTQNKLNPPTDTIIRYLINKI